MKREFIADAESIKRRFRAAYEHAQEIIAAGQGVRIAVSDYKEQRSLDQNRKLQAMCSDVAKQVDWHGGKMSIDDWRHVFVASYRKGQRAVPGIDGGFVVLGASSRELSISECADVIEIIYAFGAEQGVNWSDDLEVKNGNVAVLARRVPIL